MKLLSLIVSLSLCGGLLLAQTSGQNYALFFANTNYQNNPDFSDLKNPIKDAETIATELREMYSFSTQVYKDQDQTAIFDILTQWRQRKFGPDDQLFIFFSGHGTFRELTKKGYFVPNSQSSDFGVYVELTDLANIVTQIPCEHILLAVDACYSGTIDQEIAFKGNFQRPGGNKSAERNRLIHRQLRNKSRLLITSGGKQRTPDGKQHSPFAHAIIKKLRATYTDGDGLCTFQDLLTQLERVNPTPHQGELPKHEQGGFVFVAKDSDSPSSKTQTNQRAESNSPITTKPSVTPRTSNELDDMVFVQGGTFQMGSRKGKKDETPHQVTLSDYYIARHEVTTEEFDEYCQATGRKKPDDAGWGRGKHPVINVSWWDAVQYCNWRSSQQNLQKVYTINGTSITANWKANGYRLPTEAEWEYAARSRGKDQKWAGTSSKSQLSTYANGGEESDGYKNTAPVGSFKANDLGLFDMSGNVYEWCWDWYNYSYYKKSPADDPKGSNSSQERVIRGGAWNNGSPSLRCAFRFTSRPDGPLPNLGFRLSRAGS